MRRKVGNILFSITTVVALCLMMIGQSWAMLYSTDNFQMTGKIEAKAAFFTNAAKGNTTPAYKAGDMFKERNMGYLQIDHNLKAITGLDLQYHLVGRAMYEGVYDYGAKVFQDAYKANKDAFEKYDLKFSYALWEAYVNYKTGPFNLRLGRQNLSWGEMDVMRVIDHINPVDNTWGGTGTESLDDRRIPLWMVRAGFQKDPRFGIEGFLVPGAIDNTVGPWTPQGSPYALPLQSLGTSLNPYGMTIGSNDVWGVVTEPSRDMESSRAGLKITTAAFLDSNFSLSYQRTYWDSPAIRFKTNGGILGTDPIGNYVSPSNPGSFIIEAQYPKVNVFGLMGNHIFTDLDLIVKGEVAHVQGAPVSLPAINTPFAGVGLSTGTFTYRDQTSFGISLEKNFWIPFINKAEQVSFHCEYYGTYIHDWDESMIFGGVADPSNGAMPQIRRYEQAMDLIISTSWHYKWSVNLATLYDPRGSGMFVPTVTYRFNIPLTVELGYNAAWGQWQPFGWGKDRDAVSILARYEF